MAGVKGQRSGGHNAKTAAQHALQGTARKHRHAGLKNPAPPTGRPVPPKALKGDAKAEWDRMIARLEISKALSLVDDAVLYQYCRLFAETEALVDRQEEIQGSIDILEENIPDMSDSSDRVACFQEIGKLRQLQSSVDNKIAKGRMNQRVYLVEFGMTPASRGRVKLPSDPAKDDDGFGEFDADETTH